MDDKGITWYSLNNRLAVEEHEAVGLDEALKIVDRYLAAANQDFKMAEDALAATTLGFSRSKSDFIEICVHGPAMISYKFEMSDPNASWFRRLFAGFEHNEELHSRAELIEKVTEFFNTPIQRNRPTTDEQARVEQRRRPSHFVLSLAAGTAILESAFDSEGGAAVSREISRREFARESVLASAGVAVAAGLPAQALRAESVGDRRPNPLTATWTGRIGNLELSRLMFGGNMITGYAHSRDLDYVPAADAALPHAGEDRRNAGTAEQHGINSINTTVWDDVTLRCKAYWEKHGKTLKWIVAANPTPMSDNPFEQIDKAARDGADVIYMQGVCADALVKRKDMDLMKRAVEHMRGTGRPIGIRAHSLSVIVACEKAKLDVDFYQKTLHTHDYPTAPPPDEPAIWAASTIPGAAMRTK